MENFVRIPILLLLFFFSQGGHTSGSTQVTQAGDYYAFTLATPSIDFAPDPMTGESPEQNYHARANDSFNKLLEKNKSKIKEKVQQVMDEYKEKIKFVPYKKTYPLLYDFHLDKKDTKKEPVRMIFEVMFPEMGSLELAFSLPPDKATFETLKEKIAVIFAP